MQRLLSYIEKEKYKGWDPYDYLNSWFPFHWFGKIFQAVIVQAGKLLPFNFRPILGIKREENPKGLGLLLNAYSKLYKIYNDKKYLDIAHYLFDRLIALKSDENYYCWGYNFIWANPKQVHPKYYPSIVVTSFVGFGIFEFYQITKDKKAKEILLNISDYIHKELMWTKTKDGLCISYTKHDKSLCYNASILGAAMLARIYTINKSEILLSEIKSLVIFILAHQYDDGHWEYSLNPETGKEYCQIDFHQGFILCSLSDIFKFVDFSDDESYRLKNAITLGLDYYRKNQFTNEGVSLWRIPKKYPVDIHNQAQGIITFAELCNYNEEYINFAKTIATWTMLNMRHKKGFFFYRKYKFYTIKIPYMRWSQCWMLLAFAILKQKNKEQV